MIYTAINNHGTFCNIFSKLFILTFYLYYWSFLPQTRNNSHHPFFIYIQAFVFDLQQRNIRRAFTVRQAFTGRNPLQGKIGVKGLYGCHRKLVTNLCKQQTFVAEKQQEAHFCFPLCLVTTGAQHFGPLPNRPSAN